MRILITGSHGTIGAGLSKELVERGHEVVGLDLDHGLDERGFSLRTDVQAGVRPLRRRRVPPAGAGVRVLRPFDLVYHTAAEFGRWNGEDFYEQLWRTNAVGTKNIIRLQEKLGFRLVHFSSSEVYGDWPEI